MTRNTKGLLIAAAGALVMAAFVGAATMPSILTNDFVTPGMLRERVKEKLIDPFSAEFRNVRKVEDGLWCGEVNSKNRMGGYVGWTAFSGKHMAGLWIVALEGDLEEGNFGLAPECY